MPTFGERHHVIACVFICVSQLRYPTHSLVQTSKNLVLFGDTGGFIVFFLRGIQAVKLSVTRSG